MRDTESVVDAATNLAKFGFSVFPCRVGEKVPATPHGSKDATNNVEKIKAMFQPGNNIAIATTGSLFVLDFDKLGGWQEFEKQHQPLPATVTAKTPHGGNHLYFNSIFEVRTNQSKIGPKIDVRGIGGSVLCPPSIVDGKPYQWLEGRSPNEIAVAQAPEWLIELLFTEKTNMSTNENTFTGNAVEDDSYIERCRSYVSKMPVAIAGDNGHGKAFAVACTVYKFGLSDAGAAQVFAEYNERCTPPWSEKETAHKLQDAKKMIIERGEFGCMRINESTTVGVTESQAIDHLTDAGNAARLARLARGKNLFVASRGWHYWDNFRWVFDECGHEIERLAKRSCLIFKDNAIQDPDPDRRRKKLNFALQSESIARIRAMISMCATEPGMSCRLEDMDTDIWLLNVRNGVIDLRNGELLPHDSKRMITKLAPVDFDPAAKCPVFTRFFREIFNNNNETMDYVIRILGHCLTGDIREQMLPIFYGEGSNGKSTLIDCVMSLLGDYSGKAAEGLLIQKAHSDHPTELASLHGKRLIISSESESNARLKIQLVKSLTGDAIITARYMRQDFFEFQRTHKTILVTNNRPRVNENSPAVWRRLKLVPFTVSFSADRCDKQLPRKLEKEFSGILNVLLTGCQLWLSDGLREPASVKVSTDSYREESNLLGDWILEHCSNDPQAWESSAALYKGYSDWCERTGEKYPLSKRSFSENLARLGYQPERTNTARGWRGLSLRLV